ncbi:hypothetical protein GCM10009131_04910 [Morganella psychrotolerans]
MQISIGVVTLTGFALLDIKETSQPFGCPASITIESERNNTVFFRCMQAQTQKKTQGASCVAKMLFRVQILTPDFAGAPRI